MKKFLIGLVLVFMALSCVISVVGVVSTILQFVAGNVTGGFSDLFATLLWLALTIYLIIIMLLGKGDKNVKEHDEN